MLWFWNAYIIVTLIGILHTIFNIYVLHMKPMDKESMGEGDEKTKPWHPLYNIVIFTVFGFIYINGLSNPIIAEAFITGAIWVSICIVFDILGWVIIKHPWILTFKQFYGNFAHTKMSK